MALKCSAKRCLVFLCTKKAVTCLSEKIGVFNKLRSGMSFSAVGYELSDNESTICIK